jgi:hypothetical protein
MDTITRGAGVKAFGTEAIVIAARPASVGAETELES